jgi:two-component system, NarL family, response regulator NreC
MHRGNTTRGNITTIVIAEDHQVVRLGLTLLLRGEPDFKLVGEAGNGMEAIRLVELHEPDVLLLDLMIPQIHGLEVIRHVRASHPRTRIIILSMHKEETYVTESLRRGASGYVLKDGGSGEVIDAVRKVTLGQRYLSPALEGSTTEPAEEFTVSTVSFGAGEGADSLTKRERLVLELAAHGLSSKEVAAKLYISPRTAETHRGNLMRKLGLRSQTDLVRFAIRRRIIAA